MIDLHTHILPGLDDGPVDMDSALAQCDEAARDGIETMVATPHMFNGVYEVTRDDGTTRRIWVGGVAAASNAALLKSAGISVRVCCGFGD